MNKESEHIKIHNGLKSKTTISMIKYSRMENIHQSHFSQKKKNAISNFEIPVSDFLLTDTRWYFASLHFELLFHVGLSFPSDRDIIQTYYEVVVRGKYMLAQVVACSNTNQH